MKKDACRIDEASCDKGTGWSGAFAFNAWVCLIMFLNFVLMAIGGFWFWPRLIGTMFNCCCGCCHLFAWSVALGARFSVWGNWCAYNDASINYTGNRVFNDDATYVKDA